MSEMILFGDLETFCESPIKHGSYQYAEKCEIMLYFFAIDDGDVQVWDLTEGEEMPALLEYAIESADKYVFQNGGMFDRPVMKLATNTTPLLQYQGNELIRWRDTMVQGYCHSLPGAMEKLGDVLHVDADKQKLAIGKDLIRRFCMPQAKNVKLRRATKFTHPEEWQQFKYEYGPHDILAMREIFKKCPKWNYT